MIVVRVKVKLTFPESEVRKAVLATPGAPVRRGANIRRADVEEHRGWIVCEVDGEGAEVEAGAGLAARRRHHGGPPGRRPRGLAPLVLPGHMPTRRGNLPGLVEEAALGAAEGQRIVGVDLAPLEPLPARCCPHHVVAAILVD